MVLRIRCCFLILSLAVLLPACTAVAPSPTPTVVASQKASSSTPIIPTGTPIPTITSTPLPPTQTSIPTIAATPEVITCPASLQPEATKQMVEVLYTKENNVWLWEASTENKTKLPLPKEAAAPLISDDGQFVAFLLRDQAYDKPNHPVEALPLMLYNRQTGRIYQADAFSSVEVRKLYPESPEITLKMEWLPGGHWLLVQVFPVPWGSDVIQPSGPLFLVNAETEESRLILEAGSYERYSIRPDGAQIAALDTEAFATDGTYDFDKFQQGGLHLIPVSGNVSPSWLPLKLAPDAFSFRAPLYSPDGKRLLLNVESGLVVIDTHRAALQEIPLLNTCLEENNCFWTDIIEVRWLTDSQSFYALQSINDNYDERAKATLSLVRLKPEPRIETITTIHANLGTINFSPDRHYLTFWNQADVENIEKNPESMNWVMMYWMDLQVKQPKRYMYLSKYILRNIAWHPDNLRFLLTYGAIGGANLVNDHLALGSICQPPRELPVPTGSIVYQTQWLGANQFLARTVPSDGIGIQYEIGLYLYNLADNSAPVHIDDLVQDFQDPGLNQSQVIVLQQ